jgi:signal transduction histidine kinase
VARDSSRSAPDSWLRRRPLYVDVAIAALLAAVTLPITLRLIWLSDWQVPGRLVITALVLLAYGAVALRRVRVKSGFAVVSMTMLVLALAPTMGGAAAAQMGSDFPPILLPCSVTFPVMLYAAAAYGRGREPVTALGVAVVGAMITAWRLWDPGSWTTGVLTGNGWPLFILAAMLSGVVAPWALGRFRGVHEAYVSTLEEQARRADQDRLDDAERATTLERSRIAREMHDVIAHSLSDGQPGRGRTPCRATGSGHRPSSVRHDCDNRS